MISRNLKQPLLRLRFEGAAIRDGRILYNDFAIFVSNLSLAIERVINSLQIGESIRIGRPPKAIQVLSALEVISMSKGSFKLALDLRRKAELFPRWDIGEKAANILLQGITIIGDDVPLPQGYDHGVLIALRDAGRIIDRGVEKVHINSKSAFGARRVEYVQTTRESIISRIKRYEQRWVVIEGRLLMADVKEDSLRCRLHPSTGMPIFCAFDEAMAEQVIRNLRNFVQARGEATFDLSTNRITSLVIRDLEPVSELSPVELLPVPPSTFWTANTFDELALEQSIYPIEDWEKLTGQWPEDSNFELFMEAVRSSRQS